MNADDFREYFAAFNARDHERFTGFYAEDVVYAMDPNNGKIFHGRQAISDLYRTLWECWDEVITIENLAITDTMAAVEVPTLLTAKKDVDLEGFIPIPAGQACKMMCFNHYDFDADGLISRIRVSIHSLEYVPADAQR